MDWHGGHIPFGAYGYNPEGVRIGQDKSRHQRAVKVWDKREFKNLDDSIELGTRNIKVALKRLRKWARDGADQELDIDGTIRATAEHGYLDVQTRPEKRNAVKVLLFLDVGGSMDPYIKLVEELFSAARTEFKHLEYFTFTTACTKGCGATINAAGINKPRRMTYCAPMDPITNVSLSGMPPCRPMKLPMQGGKRTLERRGGSGVVRTCARTMGIAYLAKPYSRTALGLHPFHWHDQNHF